MSGYRIARIAFSRQVLLQGGGLSLDLFKEMLSFLPQDSKVLGFGSDTVTWVDYVLIASDSFEEVAQGQSIPEMEAIFTSTTKGEFHCSGVDFSRVIKKGSCTHNWKEYHGFMSFYEECTMCGEIK